MIQNINKKTKEILLKEFSDKMSHNTLEGEQYTTAIMVRCATDIQSSVAKIRRSNDNFQKTVKKIGQSSDKLAIKLFWLNIIFAVATTVGALATVIIAMPIIKELFNNTL